jgi:starvation-inducible outer membrane lipoprotein
MRRLKVILILGLLLSLMISGCAKQPELSKQEKLEDFNRLYQVLKENYPYFKVEKRQTGYNWLAHKEEFKNMVANTEDDFEFYQVLREIVGMLRR